MRLKMHVYGSGLVHIDELRMTRHAKAIKRRIERIIKRKNRRTERAFAEDQYQLHLEAESQYARDEERWEEQVRASMDMEDATILDDYYNQQYESAWDLERYDDDYFDEYGGEDGWSGYNRAGRILCTQCDTTSEYDSKFCKECGALLREAHMRGRVA